MTDSTPPPSERRGIARDVGLQTVGRLASLAVAMATTVIVVRALGASDYGRWATILAIAQIVGWFGEAGLERASVQQAAADPKREGEYLGGLLGLRILVAIPTTAVTALVMVALADTDDMRTAGLLLSCVVLVYAPNALRAAFQLRMRNGVPAAVSMIQTFVWGGCAVVIASSTPSLVAFAYAWLLATAAMVVVQVILARRISSARVRDGRRQWGNLLRRGIPLGIASFLVLGYTRLGQILVLKIAGPDAASQFAVVSRLLDQAQLLPLALMTTMLPVFAAMYSERPRELGKSVAMAIEYLYLLTLPAFALSLAAGTQLIVLLFGDEFAPAGAVLPILMAAFIFTSLTLVASNLFLVMGRQLRFVVIAASGLAATGVLCAIAIPYAGFVGAAWVTLATEAMVLALCVRALKPDVRFAPIGGPRCVRVAAAATVAGLGAYLLRKLGVETPLLVAVFSTAYIAGLAVFRAMSITEWRNATR